MYFITKHKLYTTRDMKIEARAQLRGNWKEAVFLSLIPTLFTIFFMQDLNNSVANQTVGFDLINLLMRIIQAFLTTSVSFTLLDFIRKREKIDPLRGAVQAFKGKYFLNLLLLKILQNIFVFLWLLLFIIPGFVKSYGYSQAERIFKDKVDRTGEVPSPLACLRESETLMYGNKLDLFTLDLSFIGWYFLALATFGLGFIWLTPYTEISQAIFYQNLIGTNEFDRMDQTKEKPASKFEEVGQDPDDFRDFEDF